MGYAVKVSCCLNLNWLIYVYAICICTIHIFLQTSIPCYGSVNYSQYHVLSNIIFFFPGQFDISHRKYQCLGCLKVISTCDPVVLTRSGFSPGSISDTTYVSEQDLLLQWDILQKQIPGISERSFLKSLELYSEQKGRVSVANPTICSLIITFDSRCIIGFCFNYKFRFDIFLCLWSNSVKSGCYSLSIYLSLLRGKDMSLGVLTLEDRSHLRDKSLDVKVVLFCQSNCPSMKLIFYCSFIDLDRQMIDDLYIRMICLSFTVKTATRRLYVNFFSVLPIQQKVIVSNW